MTTAIPSLCAASLLAAAVCAAPATAWAQRAEYARPDELRPEGLSHLLDLTLGLGYARAVDAPATQSLANLGVFSLRARALLGRRVAYCAGLDGEVGGADTGAVYGLTLHALGIGGRWGLGNAVALCGGAGFSGVGGAVPLAARFPAELSIALSLGPIRLSAWGGLAWTAGAAERAKGAPSVSFADEFEAGVAVRLGRQRGLWQQVSAGAGPSIGVTYRELMGARFVGVVIGLSLTGAQ